MGRTDGGKSGKDGNKYERKFKKEKEHVEYGSNSNNRGMVKMQGEREGRGKMERYGEANVEREKRVQWAMGGREKKRRME